MLAAHYAERCEHSEEYSYYPKTWREPYLGRRRKLAWSLYGLLGIGREDKERMSRQLGRNYEFFGAPVGLILTLDRDLEVGCWLDAGMFLQTIMIGARAYGLDTCPQQAFAKFHRIIRSQLDIPESEIVVCGMSLGYADPHEPANALNTERLPIEEFAHFIGW